MMRSILLNTAVAACVVAFTTGRAHAQAARTVPQPAGAAATQAELEIVQITPDVYMITGAGSNVAVNVGPNGLFVVDAGTAAMGEQVVATIRRISDRPVRFLASTNGDPDHVGGNPAVKQAGEAIRTRENREEGAVVVSHEAVLTRLSTPGGKEPAPVAAWPTLAFPTPQQDFAFNGQAVQMFHLPAAHTDGDVVVYFRKSDVVVTGDILDLTRYPVIDMARGGSIQGQIDAINWLLDLTVPGEKEEGGTMVIPGHGRACDESEVMEYRDMLTIVRDRIKTMVEKKMTLQQVKTAKPTFEYDPQFGASDAFVEAVFRGLQAR
jgi:glyoxylase-like metal-dependent hydrolase (beta-lactamase superfamily II)